ncbi:ANKLE1 [Cordylochernes scorpioides]|uniref:ANKLE1 n=1 Tax=Cordylochernes scorpioides TaxID=51811 RepID=A0ABY6KB96_9ARAC|nr:ANKLE1 [Cordylochernes scorpioides]
MFLHSHCIFHVGVRTEDGLTPVHIAAMWGCSEALQCLLEAGGDPWLRDAEGYNAFVLAENYGELECLQVLHKFATKKMQLHRMNTESVDMEALNTGFLQSLHLGDSDIEEHLHTDTEEGLSLLERRHIPSSSASERSESQFSLISCVEQLTNDQLRDQLTCLGERPGPVAEPTRRVYLHKLTRLLRGQPSPASLTLPRYPPEISHLIESRLDLRKQAERDQELRAEFSEARLHCREGNAKCCFTYLLLDPRMTQDISRSSLPCRDTLISFIQAIFYVGKGRNTRPLSHLFEALKTLQNGSTAVSEKVSRIREIWNAGYGVVSLHCFQNITPAEAYTREACMIEALGAVLGLSNLTNIRSGDLYGRPVGWSAAKRRRYGAYLLQGAFNIFLYEGERQIKPVDMKLS